MILLINKMILLRATMVEMQRFISLRFMLQKQFWEAPHLRSKVFRMLKNEKFGFASLNERYARYLIPEIIITDVREAKKKKLMHSHFTPVLLDELKATLAKRDRQSCFKIAVAMHPIWSARSVAGLRCVPTVMCISRITSSTMSCVVITADTGKIIFSMPCLWQQQFAHHRLRNRKDRGRAQDFFSGYNPCTIRPRCRSCQKQLPENY